MVRVNILTSSFFPAPMFDECIMELVFAGYDRSQSAWNICSVRQERGCSEMEKLEGELFFPRENFPFPRSDSCLAERSEGRQSRSRKRKALEEKKGA